MSPCQESTPAPPPRHQHHNAGTAYARCSRCACMRRATPFKPACRDACEGVRSHREAQPPHRPAEPAGSGDCTHDAACRPREALSMLGSTQQPLCACCDGARAGPLSTARIRTRLNHANQAGLEAFPCLMCILSVVRGWEACVASSTSRRAAVRAGCWAAASVPPIATRGGLWGLVLRCCGGVQRGARAGVERMSWRWRWRCACVFWRPLKLRGGTSSRAGLGSGQPMTALHRCTCEARGRWRADEPCSGWFKNTSTATGFLVECARGRCVGECGNTGGLPKLRNLSGMRNSCVVEVVCSLGVPAAAHHNISTRLPPSGQTRCTQQPHHSIKAVHVAFTQCFEYVVCGYPCTCQSR